MIVWVFFESGVGGDGVANLLEHGSRAVSIDSELKWRIHRYVDYNVKFWAPNLPGLDHRGNTVDQLTEQHIEIANSNDQYLIITSHDLQLKSVFSNNTVPKEKHIKLLLTYDDFVKQQINFKTKNLIEFDQSKLTTYRRVLKHGAMDFILNVDKINDWVYTKNIVDQIGLQLAQKDFDNYKKIVAREMLYDTPGIEHYKSYLINGVTKYMKIN
jgi:hypothetical protein